MPLSWKEENLMILNEVFDCIRGNSMPIPPLK